MPRTADGYEHIRKHNVAFRHVFISYSLKKKNLESCVNADICQGSKHAYFSIHTAHTHLTV